MALERAIAWLSAVQQRALAALNVDVTTLDIGDALTNPDSRAVQRALDEAYDDAVIDIRCALRLSRLAASSRLDLATALIGPLAPTLRLLDTGQITLHHARTVHTVVLSCDADSAGDLQVQVLPGAPEQPPANSPRLRGGSP